MNQEHLIDSIVLLPQLRDGLMTCCSVRSCWVVFLVVAGLAVRSLSRLRGWRQRARALTLHQLTRAIAPHVIVPVAMVLAVYQLSPMLVGNPFNIAGSGAGTPPMCCCCSRSQPFRMPCRASS